MHTPKKKPPCIMKLLRYFDEEFPDLQGHQRRALQSAGFRVGRNFHGDEVVWDPKRGGFNNAWVMWERYNASR